mgnify:CR=1 FL=1
MIKVLALIPARGGSKGLKNKNILDLGGIPLIAHSIKSALSSRSITKTVVMSDSNKILSIAKKFGADTIKLPTNLTEDRSPVIGSTLFTLSELEKKGHTFNAIALLEPTSPLRASHDIDKAIELLNKNINKTDAIVSLGEVHLESPFIMKKIEKGFIFPIMEEKNIQRQLLPKAYFPYGVIYLIKTDILLKEKTFYPKRILPYIIERWQNYEIDDIYDLLAIRSVFDYKNKKK